MNLAELKGLMGIALEGTSQDVILSLYLESALEAAKTYANNFNWTQTVLPGPLKLGILRYVELSQARKSTAGIASQSIAGMSQTFKDDGGDSYFREAYEIWNPYHKNGLVFSPAKRKNVPIRKNRFL
jgi:hypothetical protein